METNSACPFCAILRGDAPGMIIARDDDRRFAIIKSIHPESVVHWLAVPFEHEDSTEAFEGADGGRFIELFEWAMQQARTPAALEQEPRLVQGFTLKTHFGAFESVPHPKIHILAVE